jgi:hypothetical protein
MHAGHHKPLSIRRRDKPLSIMHSLSPEHHILSDAEFLKRMVLPPLPAITQGRTQRKPDRVLGDLPVVALSISLIVKEHRVVAGYDAKHTEAEDLIRYTFWRTPVIRIKVANILPDGVFRTQISHLPSRQCA